MEGYYKIVELDKFGGKLKFKERSFRNIKRYEILVKVMCTTIHPTDIMFMKGNYGDIKPTIFPVIPGFEGSGEIIKVGEDIDRKIVGKRVAVFAESNHPGSFDGIWAEYHYTTLPYVMLFDQDTPYDRICFIINPLTAIGMIDTVKKANESSVVLSGASSNVGKMFIKLCRRESIQTVNIVKGQPSTKELLAIKASNIINTDDVDWENELRKLSDQLKATIAFDCIGGEFTGKLFSLLPNGSTMYHFGNLMQQEIGKVQSADFIFKDKTLCGWWLLRWIQSISQEEMEYWWDFIRSELISKSETFQTDIAKEFTLHDIEKAISFYQSNMGLGKVILKPIISS